MAAESDGKGKVLSSDESYELHLEVGERRGSLAEVSATLSSATVWGALYGLTTFTQLFFRSSAPANKSLLVASALPITVQDSPRFPWRGVLLDTANHYFRLLMFFVQ